MRPWTPWAATVWIGMPSCVANGVRTTPMGVNVTASATGR
jgi:hypothetical protein